MLFRDRHDAGKQLARPLQAERDNRPVIFAMARGGIPVGYEIAKALDAPLEPVVVRKLGVPFQPEFAFGAIAPGGVTVINEAVIELLGISRNQVEAIREEALEEMRSLEMVLKSTFSVHMVANKTIILVDDGIATGATIEAAIVAISRLNPKRLVLAVPVASPEVIDRLTEEVDAVYCLTMPEDLVAVGNWYAEFPQVNTDEAVALLRDAKRLGITRSFT